MSLSSTSVSCIFFTFSCCCLQLFQACGNLREGGTSSTGVNDFMTRGKVLVEDKLGYSSDKMDKLVSNYPTESVPLLLLSDRLIWPFGIDGL